MNNFRVFRLFPLFKDRKDYLAWLAKVEKKKTQVWKDMRIFGMIQRSKAGPGYRQAMLIASLYFWDSTHNSFHLPCGMMSQTLFDVVAITGLRPTGETYGPNFMAKDTIGFDGS